MIADAGLDLLYVYHVPVLWIPAIHAGMTIIYLVNVYLELKSLF